MTRYPLRLVVSEGANVAKAWASRALGRALSRPMTANLILTEKCNSRCTTCDYWKRNVRAKDELSLEDLDHIAQDLSEMGTRMVALSGGEPTLREDLAEIVRAFKRRDFLVQITTNGLLLDTERGEALLRSGIDRITVSLDSHLPDRYKQIRGVDAADDLLRRLTALLRRSPRPIVETNTVLMAQNLDEVPDTLEHVLGLGIDGVNLSPAVVEGDNNVLDGDKLELLPADDARVRRTVARLLDLKRREPSRMRPSVAFLEGIVPYFRNPQRPAFDCWAGYVSIDVYQDGAVRLCGSTAPIGNARAGLRQVWESAEAETRRREMLRGECPGCHVSCKAEPSIVVAPRTGVRAALGRLRA